MIRREFTTLKTFVEGVKACEVLNLPYYHGKHDDGIGGSFWVITLEVSAKKSANN